MTNLVLSAALMVLAGLLAGVLAKRVWRIELKWLWCGALLWAVAVGVKFLLAAVLSRPVLLFLKGHLVYSAFLAFGALYIGLLTSLTEVLFTFIAGLRWRQLTYDAQRAVGIGLGAGAIEAIGLGIVAPFLAGGQSAGLSLAILVPVVERLLCIPSHTAVRAMSLYAVATSRWRWFWGALVMFTAIDGAAGFYHLHRRSSIGYVVSETCLITCMLLSVFVLRYLWKHWPALTDPRQPLSSEVNPEAAPTPSTILQ